MRHPFITFLTELGTFWWFNCLMTASVAGLLIALMHLPIWQAIPFGLVAGYLGSKLQQKLMR
jgi:hypothetical protein